MTRIPCITLLLGLIVSLVLPAAPAGAAEAAFLSITVESVGRDGRAHKTVNADGTMQGGHLSGMPPRIFRNEGAMPPDDFGQLPELLAQLPAAAGEVRQGTAFRGISISTSGHDQLNFIAPDNEPFREQILEQLYRLIARQRVGGW